MGGREGGREVEWWGWGWGGFGLSLVGGVAIGLWVRWSWKGFICYSI
jgi:hypothetical protein